MMLFTTVAELDLWVETQLSNHRTIGMVPTMGALHQGHIALVQKAMQDNDTVVVTVFVNPVQFNNATDLERYPRTFVADRQLLEAAGVDVMFFPSVDEVYPQMEAVHYELDGLDAHMEGPNRPGHFDGVVQVVSRFFDIVRPTAAYFGEKDFQQIAIIRHMARKLGYALEVVGCPTVRESDGLAMSSRNTLLSNEDRFLATEIYRGLQLAKTLLLEEGVEIARTRTLQLLQHAGFTPEYVELVDPERLAPVDDDWEGPVQACVAAWIGRVRLIDNLKLK